MLISATVWMALAEAGVTLVPLDAKHVELRHADATSALAVVASAVPLNPSDVAELAGRHIQPGLLIVPSATIPAQQAAEAAGWSWLVDAGQQVSGVLHIAGHRIVLDERAEPAHQPRRTHRGPVPWGMFTLVRRLIERPHADQKGLAALVGVSQPRISQALSKLADQRLVQRTPAGWAVRDVDEIVRWWLETYPGPGGIRTLWYGLEAPLEQARRVLALVDSDPGARQLKPPGALLSGDVAADFIAPWRSPNRAVVYARSGLDLAVASLSPASENDATLEFIVPKDPGIWPTPRDARQESESLPLADPLQILWDVRRSPGADTDEAVQRLLRPLRERWQKADGGHAV